MKPAQRNHNVGGHLLQRLPVRVDRVHSRLSHLLVQIRHGVIKGTRRLFGRRSRGVARDGRQVGQRGSLKRLQVQPPRRHDAHPTGIAATAAARRSSRPAGASGVDVPLTASIGNTQPIQQADGLLAEILQQQLHLAVATRLTRELAAEDA